MLKQSKRRRRQPVRKAEEASFDVEKLDELQLALLKLMTVRFRDFRARFGREPNQDEPLFF